MGDLKECDNAAEAVLEMDTTMTGSSSQSLRVQVDNRYNYSIKGVEDEQKPTEKKVAKENEAFEQFTNKSGNKIRKECLHKNVLRSMKKTCKEILSPTKTATCKATARLIDIVRSDEAFYRLFISAIEYPASEGVAKRKKKRARSDCRSFNVPFLKRIYGELKVRQLHAAYIEGIWSTPERMCKEFSVRCCHGAHNDDCVEAWKDLYKYLKTTMLENLGFEEYDYAIATLKNQSCQPRKKTKFIGAGI